MKFAFVLTGMLFLFASVSHAQLIVDPNTNQPVKTTSKTTTKTKSKFNFDKSVDKANTAVTNTNNSVSKSSDFLSSTTEAAKNLVHKVGAMLPASKNKGINTTEINIKGINFSKLNKLNDDVGHCSGVKDSKIKYNSSKSTITVTHTGTTSRLLKQLEKRAKDIFTEANVANSNEGKISIKLN
jgi:hypothetical protein